MCMYVCVFVYANVLINGSYMYAIALMYMCVSVVFAFYKTAKY